MAVLCPQCESDVSTDIEILENDGEEPGCLIDCEECGATLEVTSFNPPEVIVYNADKDFESEED